ncbi:hypothetical protein [Paraburkholderia oxyphila]|uniref:hypothetical protein n=1 Tax=Paraburkholderia oxyphila TaxID=614212 RepID=UPI0012EDA267|nr:hypothetical protein [Paraburkholderia oxyphila]
MLDGLAPGSTRQALLPCLFCLQRASTQAKLTPAANSGGTRRLTAREQGRLRIGLCKNENYYGLETGFAPGRTLESLHATDSRRNDNIYRNRAILLLNLDENGKV